MSYRVRTEAFEGPFDLLLYLVGRQKVAIDSISLSDIVSQYLDEVERMRSLDLEVASEFLVVAATLLEIKAARIVAAPDEGEGDDGDELSPEDARRELYERLVEYKRFKNAAADLSRRFEAQARMHARTAGPDPAFRHLAPDLLARTSPEDLARAFVRAASRTTPVLLESDHIERARLSLPDYLGEVALRVAREGSTTFRDLVGPDAAPELVVVCFLAMLELYKHGLIAVRQEGGFAEIHLEAIPGVDPTAALDLTDVDDYDLPGAAAAELASGKAAQSVPAASAAPAASAPASSAAPASDATSATDAPSSAPSPDDTRQEKGSARA